MVQYSNLDRVMAARDHFKNRASSRNLMSKFFFVLCLAILFGCERGEDMVDPEKYVMFKATPVATIDDGKVHLKWGPFYWWGPYCPTCPEVVEPDIIEIYISENELSNFRKFTEVRNDGKNYSYTVDKLQNGKPYFFYLVSQKKGFKPLYSDTIMVVPNIRKGFEILQKSNEEHVPRLASISIAHQISKVAYVDRFHYWDGGSNCCMEVSILVSNMDGSEKELVRINGYNPNWSPANDKIVFHFDGTHNVGRFPAQIAMYDYETKSITQLTHDNYYNYSPVFSKNGESLLFQSSKNTPGTYETNIWMMDLKTHQTFQITDISKTSLRTVERPCWIDNDRFLFHGAYSEGKNQYRLFESTVSKKQISKIFESKWNDYNPSISPDQNKIAFISNRSGFNQVWVYHIDSRTFSQITGYSNNESLTYEWSKVEWLDNSTIVFTINENQLVKQRVE